MGTSQGHHQIWRIEMKQEEIDECRKFFESDREDSEIADLARLEVPGLLNLIENQKELLNSVGTMADDVIKLLARVQGFNDAE